ncbi:hypothetical protein ABBQ32_004764 [Trebouxia sp. C0010 RCD-2024]
MLKPANTKKRKKSDLAAVLGRTAAGSAFAQCPICSRQVPLLTINIHLGSKECSEVCPSPKIQCRPSLKKQCREESSAQEKGAHQTLTSVAPLPAVLQLQHTSSDLSAGRSGYVADCMQHAAMHLTVSKPLLPNTDCEGSAIVAEGSWHPNFNETVIPVHQASAARPGKHQPSDTLQAAMPGTIHMSLVPHAELVGEYRVPNFVTEQEEVDIVHMLDTVAPPWKDSSFNGKHRGKRFGAEMDLNKRTVVEGTTAMPPILNALITRMQQLPLLQAFKPNEANAIDYRTSLGHWLKAHVDDRQLSTDKIVTLSLVGSASMTFSCKKRDHSVIVDLPARTLQVITKEARYSYTHGIAKPALSGPRRVSVTFRQSPFKK